jgi:hypothetical protein
MQALINRRLTPPTRVKTSAADPADPGETSAADPADSVEKSSVHSVAGGALGAEVEPAR